MPLTPITDYAPGEIIPSAWANTLKANQAALDSRTGGDPGATGRFLASSGALGGLWRLLQAGDFGAGIVPDAALANPKVNQLSVDVASFAAALPGSGFYRVGLPPDGPVGPVGDWHLIQARSQNWAQDYRAQIVMDATNPNGIYLRMIVAGSAGAWFRMWHAGNDGSGSGLDAGLLEGSTKAEIIAASAGSVPGLAAGIGAYWTGAAASIPVGWARHAAANGRILVGDGTTFGQAFAVNGAYGASWAHAHDLSNHAHDFNHGHTINDHAHGGASLGVAGTTGGPSSTGNYGSGGAVAADGSHTHGVGSLDVNGATQNASIGANGLGATPTGAPGPNASGVTTWLPPMQGVVWIVKQ